MCLVLDENDNPPEFSQSSFHIIIPENLPPGVIHTVQASDPDNGVNGTVKYSIQSEWTLVSFYLRASCNTSLNLLHIISLHTVLVHIRP